MKTILVTTDLSDESTAAFEVAAEMARCWQAQVKLLAIIEDPAQAALLFAMDFPVMPDTEVQKQFREKVERDLRDVAQAYFAGLSYECVVVEAAGHIASEIVDFAAAQKVDLIVMSRGRSGITRLLIGTVTTKVVREAPCPVLVVPVKLGSVGE